MAKKNDLNTLGVLTGKQIEDFNIIVLDNENDCDKSCYDKASYNLRLGAKYYRPNLKEEKIKSEVCEIDNYPHCPHREYLLKNKIEDCNYNNRVLVIQPFTSVVISTLERLKLPSNVVGRFDLKIRWALQGLILQVGTQVAPGYQGRLFGLLHNLSNKEICIPMKIGILDAEFSFISGKVVPQEFDESFNTLEGFLKSRPPIEGTLEAFLKVVKAEKQEMNSMKDKAEELKKQLDISLNDLQGELEKNREKLQGSKFKYWSISGGIIASFIILALTIVLPIIVTKSTVDKDDYPFKKVFEMEIQNKKMYSKIDSVINLNKSKINLLLQNNSFANDTIEILKSQIIKLEKQLQNQADKSKRGKNGK